MVLKTNLLEETGTWNNAQKFSDYKFMRLMELSEELEIIADIGSKNLEESIKNNSRNQNKTNYVRLEALNHLLFSLEQLLNNSTFAIKNNINQFKNQKNKVNLLRKRILPLLYLRINKEEVILKKEFDLVLSIVKKLKSEINTPLNRNNLIFLGGKKEWSTQEIKERIMKNATTRG